MLALIWQTIIGWSRDAQLIVTIIIATIITLIWIISFSVISVFWLSDIYSEHLGFVSPIHWDAVRVLMPLNVSKIPDSDGITDLI